MADFRNRVREYRAIVGRGELTQQALADHAGISVTTLSEIENGKVAPSMRTARALAQALGASLDDLFWGAAVTAPPTDRLESGTADVAPPPEDPTRTNTTLGGQTPPSGLPTASTSIERDGTADEAPVGNR